MYFSLPQLFVFLFDVLGLAALVHQRQICKKANLCLNIYPCVIKYYPTLYPPPHPTLCLTLVLVLQSGTDSHPNLKPSIHFTVLKAKNVPCSTPYTVLDLYLYDTNVIKHHLCNYVYAQSVLIHISVVNMSVIACDLVVLTVICTNVDSATNLWYRVRDFICNTVSNLRIFNVRLVQQKSWQQGTTENYNVK